MKKYLIPILISLIIIGSGTGIAATLIYPYQGGTGQDSSVWTGTGCVRVVNGTWSTTTCGGTGSADSDWTISGTTMMATDTINLVQIVGDASISASSTLYGNISLATSGDAYVLFNAGADYLMWDEGGDRFFISDSIATNDDIIAATGTFSGNLSITGTLTYGSTTNWDLSYQWATSSWTLLSASSSNWDLGYQGYVIVSASSSNWDSTYNIVNVSSTNWNVAYNYVNSSSTNWDLGYNSSLVVVASSSNWDSAYNIVNSSSTNWDITYNVVNASSSNWNSTYNIVNSSSSNWDSAYNYINASSTNWDSGYDSSLIVSASSSNWDLAWGWATSNTAILIASSTNWETAYNYVNASSTNWDAGYNSSLIVNASSSNWDVAYDIVNASSSNWDNIYNIVNSSSTNWDSVYNYFNASSSNLDSAYQWASTYNSSSSNYDLTYNIVNDSSTNWDSAYNYYNASSSNLDSAYQWASIYNSSSSNYDFTYNIVNSSSSNWDSTYNYVNASSSNLDSAYQWASIYNSSSSNYDLTYNIVNASSSNWDFIYNIVNASSSNWDSAYNYVNASSSNWDLGYNSHLIVNASSSNWDTAYNYINASSTNWDLGYNSSLIVTASSSNWDSAYSIVNASSSNWDSAYNWGSIFNSSSTNYDLAYIWATSSETLLNASSSNWDTAYTWATATKTLIEDSDSDTMVQTEESADEDIIHFDTGGAERAHLDSISLDMAVDVDFNTYKAIAMTCDNGATVPAAPTTGQWFLHTPTGRKVLMMYSDSNWIPIISIGSMTMYVNIDGSTQHDDNIDLGYDTNNTFDTIQYAIDQIPGLVGGNVVIYIDDGEAATNIYDETVTVRGKAFTGDYTISIYGNLISQKSGTTDNDAANNVQGTDWTYGIVYDSGGFGADYENHIVYVDSTDYRIIDKMGYSMGYEAGQNGMEPVAGEMIEGDTSGAWGVIIKVDTNSGSWAGSDAAGVIYYVPTAGTFQDDETVDVMSDSTTEVHGNAFNVEVDEGAIGQDLTRIAVPRPLSAVPSNKSYVVYDWGTTVNKIQVEAAQQGIYLYDLKCDTGVSLTTQNYSSVYGDRLHLTAATANYYAYLQLDNSYATYGAASYVIDVVNVSYLMLQGSKVYSSSDGDACVRANNGPQVQIRYGCVLDASNQNNTIGVNLNRNGVLGAWSSSAGGKTRIRNQKYGIQATTGANAGNTSNIQYSNNATNDEYATAEGAAGYSYID